MQELRKLAKKVVDSVIPGNDPTFIIVGAQKAGTTSLHYYLNQHPKIIGSRPKEVRFFDTDATYAKGYSWYRKAFKDVTKPFKEGIYFEATPEYMYRSFSAERIFDFNPDMKIIMMLREPVKRAYSSWNMYRDFPIKFKTLPSALHSGYIQDRENNLVKELYSSKQFPTFKETFKKELEKIDTNSKLEEPSFIRRGIYLPQIKRYHELFGKDNVLILGFQDLISKKVETLNYVLRFLGLPESDWRFLNDEKKNFRSYPEKISPEMKQSLKEFYEPYNEALFQYLGTKINW